MKRTKFRLALCVGLLILLLGFIWGNSALPAEDSGEVSGGVLALLKGLLPFLEGENAEHLLRKAAHFSEFAALGACFCWLFGMLGKKWVFGPLCGGAAAFIDEFIQIFSPGRYSSLRDVALDCAGVLTGSLILGLLLRRRRKT